MTVKIEEPNALAMEENPVKKKKSPWRWFKRLFYTLLILIIVLIGLLTAVIFTETGLKLVDYGLKKSPISEMVQLENVSGTLWKGIEFDRLTIVLNEQNHIELSKAKLVWDLSKLLDKSVTIKSLSVAQADIILTQSSESKKEEPEGPPFLPFSLTRGDLPVDIDITFVEADKVAVMLPAMSIYADKAQVKDAIISETKWAFDDVSYEGFLTIGKDFTLPLDASATIVANRLTNDVSIRLKNSTQDMRIGDDYFDHAMSILITGTLNNLTFHDAITFNWPDQIAKPLVIEVKGNIKNQADLSWDLTLFNISNQLTSTGQWSLNHPDRLTASLDLYLSELKDAYPELSGTLKGDLSFAGDFKKPLLSGNIVGRDIKGFGLTLDAIDVKADHNEVQTTEFLTSLTNLQFNEFMMKSAKIQLYAEKIEQFDFSTHIQNIVDKNKTLVDNIQLTSVGTLDDHKIQLSVRSIFNTTDFEGIGHINTDSFNDWSLDINKLDIYSDIVGRYKLSKPATLLVSPEHINLSLLCLEELPTTFCMQGMRNDENIYGSIVLRRLHPKKLNSILPDDIKIDTTADLVVSGQFIDTKNFKGIVDVSLSNGEVRYRLHGYELKIPLKTTKAIIHAKPSEITTHVNIDWGEYLQIHGGGQMKEPFGEQLVDVMIEGKAPTLSWILPIVPSLQKLAGQLTMKLETSGQLSKGLNIGFNMGLVNGEIYNAEYNSSIKNIVLNLNLQKGQPVLLVDGGLTAGTGRLSVNGQIDLKSFESSVKVQGNGLLLADSSNVKVLASPNINVKLNKTGAVMTGNLIVPELRFIYKSSDDPRGSVQTVSSDTVVISSKRPEMEHKKESQFWQNSTVNFDVVLGDNVSVGAVGFVGKLTGKIDLQKTIHQPLTALGIINIGSGVYNVLGQELKLDKGKIQFTGLDIANPNIEFQASRSFENKRTGSKVSVGVRVTGTANNPKLNLFSQPPMPTNSIVSYLALGTDVDSLTAVEVLQIAKMAQRIASGEIVTSPENGFAKNLGLSDFGIMKDLSGNTSLGIGKYLTQNFYVGIGFSIFEQQNSAFGLLRYGFLNYFSFDAQVSDEYSTLDLRFSKEM